MIETAGSAPPPPHDAGMALCAPFVAALPVTGVSVSVVGGSGQSTIGASDVVAARVEELQFDLGEGPHWVAVRTGMPALAPDVCGSDGSEWPVLAQAIRQVGVCAVFAFPLRMGAVTVGVVDMYRVEPGPLGVAERARAVSLAAAAAGPALRIAARSARRKVPSAALLPELRREVHQATGMVLVQLDSSATDAFARLQAHAFSTGQTLEEVAHAVVTRRLSFRGESG